jgi:TPP-dependent indolepyruvate ferredoxin oxidoreductase alpha subunit
MKSSILADLAYSLKKGGIKRAYNFPGYHSHKLFNYFQNSTTSTNEKVAYELAWGASQAGTPALVTFKNVGLSVAADPFLNSLLAGVGGGLVVVIFDDIEVEGSQSYFDSRHYYNFYGGLWFEPYDYQSLMAISEAAPKLSKIFDIPIVIRLTNLSIRFNKQVSSFLPVPKIIKLATDSIGNNLLKAEPVVHPINSSDQLQNLLLKNRIIQQFINTLDKTINPEALAGKIYCGFSSVRASSHVISLPVPSDYHLNDIQEIHEVGDDVIWQELIGQRSANQKSFTLKIKPTNARQYIISKRYHKLFKLLKPSFRNIVGDLGEYTKDDLETVTHCLCLGSSLPIACGMLDAGEKKVLAITGDGAFMHSGKNFVDEAIVRKLNFKLLLINNGGSHSTGGQKIPGTIPNQIKVINIDLDNVRKSELKNTVDLFIASESPIILNAIYKV